MRMLEMAFGVGQSVNLVIFPMKSLLTLVALLSDTLSMPGLLNSPEVQIVPLALLRNAKLASLL